jgi:hypothetical protein
MIPARVIIHTINARKRFGHACREQVELKCLTLLHSMAKRLARQYFQSVLQYETMLVQVTQQV